MTVESFASLYAGVAITNGEPKWLGVSGNIPAGTYFEADGRWYQALRVIVRGEQIVEGYNAQGVDLADVVNQLNTANSQTNS